MQIKAKNIVCFIKIFAFDGINHAKTRISRYCVRRIKVWRCKCLPLT